MMGLGRSIAKTMRGAALSLKEEKALKRHLRLRRPFWAFFLLCLLVVLGAALAYFSTGRHDFFPKNILTLLLGALMSAFAFTSLTFRGRLQAIKRYLKALDHFHEERFKAFKGFIQVHVSHRPAFEAYFTKDNVHLLTDGYNFLMFDGFTRTTDVKLPNRFKSGWNKKPLCPVLDALTLEKSRIIFKLNDIKYFSLAKNYKPKKLPKTETLGYRYAFITSKQHIIPDDEIVLLRLNDETAYRFGIEAYPFFKKVMPQKERRSL